MATEKLFKLVALTALALLASSFGPTPVTALSPGSQHLNRHVAHEAIAKRQRDGPSKRDTPTKRCKPRPSSSLTSSSATTTTTHTSSHVSTSTSSPAPSPTTDHVAAPSSGGNGNGGFLLIGGGPDDPSELMSYSSVQALYNWAPTYGQTSQLQGKPFWPMYWGARDNGDIEGLPDGGPNSLMFGENEINQSNEANLSPQDACTLYEQYVAPYAAKGYTLVSPSTSSAPGTDLQQWFQICGNKLGVTKAQAHWYDTCPQNLISWVENIHTTTGADVYLTEYAVANFRGSSFHGGADPSDDPNYVIQFHATTWPQLKALGYVHVAAPFGFFSDPMPGGVGENNRLITQGTSSPNSLGMMFLTDSFPAPQADYPFWCD